MTAKVAKSGIVPERKREDHLVYTWYRVQPQRSQAFRGRASQHALDNDVSPHWLASGIILIPSLSPALTWCLVFLDGSAV